MFNQFCIKIHNFLDWCETSWNPKFFGEFLEYHPLPDLNMLAVIHKKHSAFHFKINKINDCPNIFILFLKEYLGK